MELAPTSQLSSIIGQEYTERGLLNLHEALQCPFLVKSLSYTILDMLLVELFPEMSHEVEGINNIKEF